MKKALCVVMCGLLAGIGISCRAPAPRETAPSEADPMISVNTLIDAPEGFLEDRLASGDYPIPPYAKFLADVKICLDPGHGGQAHKRGYKRGPTGVREAEMNLRVAQYLAALLEEAGAIVKLTRDGDYDLTLAERAGVANDWDADLFISLHHNAIGKKPHVNYTTVWYHNDVDYRPSDLDLAWYLCQGLYDALGLEQVTDVPLKSDQLMYEAGFGVLRSAEVTAALSETSFFTNPEEEQRLRQPEYNLREAYGLFKGLARYAAAGLPRAALIEPAEGVIDASEGDSLVFELDDGLRGRKAWGHDRKMILTDSVAARIDGNTAPYAFSDDGERYLLTVSLPDDLEPGQHAIEIQFQNMSKNSVLNPHFAIEVR